MVVKWNDKYVVWSGWGYHIAVNNPDDVSYVTVWTDDNKKVGFLSSRTITGYRDWLSIQEAELSRSHRRKGLGLLMYKVMIQYMDPRYKGLVGYRPGIINRKAVPAIYKRLGGYIDPENEDVWLVPRKTFFESVEDEPVHDPDGAEAAAIRKSRKAPTKHVRQSVRALSARGKPAKLNPYRLAEMVQRPMGGALTATYDVMDQDGAVVGSAAVSSGVIGELFYDTEVSVEYRLQIMDVLLSQMVAEADRAISDLVIHVEDIDGDVKYLFERYGFRGTQRGIMRRIAGSIRPPSVISVPGMGNRD